MIITVQTHMPFAGKQRRPGDPLTKKEWLTASDAARRALVNQGLVTVSGESAAAGSQPVAVESEHSVDVIELLQMIAAKQDRILSHLGLGPFEGEPVLARGARVPAPRKPRKGKAKR